MEVIRTGGEHAELPEDKVGKLYISDRRSLKAWQELEDEMKRLGIVAFKDPVLGDYSKDLVSIEYVHNWVLAYQRNIRSDS